MRVAQCAGYDMGGLVKWLSWSGWSGIGRSRVAFCVGLDVCICGAVKAVSCGYH